MKLQSIREQLVQPIFLINLVLNVETKEILEHEDDDEALLNDEKSTGKIK